MRTCRSSERFRRPAGRGCSRGLRTAAVISAAPRRSSRRKVAGRILAQPAAADTTAVGIPGRSAAMTTASRTTSRFHSVARAAESLSALAGREDPDDAHAPLSSGPPRPAGRPSPSRRPHRRQRPARVEPRRCERTPRLPRSRSRSPLHELQQHRMFGDEERLERPDHQSESDDPEDRTHEGQVQSGGGSLPWHVSPETCGSLDVLCVRHRRYRNPPGYKRPPAAPRASREAAGHIRWMRGRDGVGRAR